VNPSHRVRKNNDNDIISISEYRTLLYMYVINTAVQHKGYIPIIQRVMQNGH
jgi:hypothetical protein